MKQFLRIASVAAALGLALALAAPGSLPAAQAKGLSFVVDNDTDLTSCKGKTHDTIGSAVTDIVSSDGKSGTITVCPGLYEESILIDGAISLKLTGKPGAKIVPPSDDYDGPILRVENSANVTVQGFTIDGYGRFTGSGPATGIHYENAGGTITKNYLLSIRNTAVLSTCPNIGSQLDTGINVLNAPTPVKVFRNTVYDYGCIGIAVKNSPKTSVSKNLLWGTVFTSNPSLHAQIVGIRFETSDNGSITSNTIEGDWNPYVTTTSYGIWMFDSYKVKMSGNRVSYLDTGLWVSAETDGRHSDYLTISANRFNGVRYGIGISVYASEFATLGVSSDNDKITSNTLYAPTFEGTTAVWLSSDDESAAIDPSLNNTTLSGNKQFGFLLYSGRIVRDDSGGTTNYSTSNKTIPPPTGP